MRTPKKSRELYETLSEQIRDGVLPPGMLLPREVEMAGEFGVARDTLRSALRELEADGLIRRVRGQGTFVAALDKPLTVTYLLPCADYEKASGISSRRTHSEMLFGLLQAAANCNCKVEALPLTATNDPKDINWGLLADLDANSRVILAGEWFKEVFPLLLEKNCRVGLIWHEGSARQSFLERWQIWETGRTGGLLQLAALLQKRGRRRIAISRLPGLTSYDVPGIQEIITGDEIGKIRRELGKHDFDALIVDNAIIRNFDSRRSLHENFGLPENIQIVLADRNCYEDVITRETASAYYPYQEIAKQMLAELIPGRYQPCHHQISAQIQEEIHGKI